MITVSPDALKILLRDWVLERQGYEPYIECTTIDPKDDVAEMREKNGGQWINRAACLYRIEDLIARAMDND